MFDLLGEQKGIRFDEYTSGSAAADKGAAMKIVLAEKVSPATLAVFSDEPGWDVKTHDQLPEGLAAALATRPAPRHRGDEYARRECCCGCRADHWPDDRAGSQSSGGQCHNARGQMGEEK